MNYFSELPKDSLGNPVQGHLTQASHYWWGRKAIEAGFAVDFEKMQHVRRKWEEASQWWNLFICRKILPYPTATQQNRRLAEFLRPAFRALRGNPHEAFVNTGIVIRTDCGKKLVAATPQNRIDYLYYGPYADLEKGVYCLFLSMSLPLQTDIDSSPVAYLEVTFGGKVLATRKLTVADFAGARTSRHIPLVFETPGGSDHQFKVFYLGQTDLVLDLGWELYRTKAGKLDSTDAGNRMVPANVANVSAGWVEREQSNLIEGRCWFTEEFDQEIEFSLPCRRAVISFVRGPWSGSVELRTDERQARTVDLYADKVDMQFTALLEFEKPGTHQVIARTRKQSNAKALNSQVYVVGCWGLCKGALTTITQ